MFSKTIKDNKIPPNFLNSILTNPSLYSMFKNEFDENSEYFQNIEKEEYLSAMIEFIENSLFSGNLFHIYSEVDDLENYKEGSLSYIRCFYDDFLLEEFKRDPESILKTKFFRGLEYAKKNDLYAARINEFTKLYDYVFHESLDYEDIVSVLIKDAKEKLANGEVLSLKDFDILCFYVKNNIAGYIDMDMVTKMLKNHAYKYNHIFERGVVEELVSSTIKSYLENSGVEAHIVYQNGLEDKALSGHDLNTHTFYIDYSLIDGFISLNYIELFEYAFLEAEQILTYELLNRNECSYRTLKVLMNLVVNKVDIRRFIEDSNYYPTNYYADLKASSFLKAMRFFSSLGVNLYKNYIQSKTAKVDFTDIDVSPQLSFKEISLDQRFFAAFDKSPHKLELIKKYRVLSSIFTKDGNRVRTIDLIKKLGKGDNRDFLEEYLNSRIIEPEVMIEDVVDLSGYRPKDEDIANLIEKEVKYIYTDSFFYSLDSFLKLKKAKNFDAEEYLDDLLIRINCIKNTPLVHRFIDEAIFIIDDMKQNV